MIKSFVAEGAIATRRIVKMGSADGMALQSAAATDESVGVSDLAASAGQDVDVTLLGLTKVTLGGTVGRGKRCVADANGCAVVAAPAAGANVHVVGYPLVAGVAGDIVPFVVAPCVMQG